MLIDERKKCEKLWHRMQDISAKINVHSSAKNNSLPIDWWSENVSAKHLTWALLVIIVKTTTSDASFNQYLEAVSSDNIRGR